jgi:Na+/melibiose symporter-like transporter
VIGVRAGYLLHDAVSANIRGGVSSGASTLSWLAFLPLSLLFGWVSRGHGVQSAGWLIAVVAAAAAVLLLRTAQRRAQAEPPTAANATPCPDEPALAIA